MQEVTIKKDSNVTLDKEIKLFLNPKFVFLPLQEGFKLKVRDNDYVYKNDIVAMNKRDEEVISSISGKVLGIKKMDFLSAKNIPCLVVENDFKENIRSKTSAKRYINDYSKKDFLRLLADTSYSHRGQDTSKKYSTVCEEIIVNGVDLDPYFGNRYVVLRDEVEDILETVDYLANILEAKKIYFVIKNTDNELIGKLTSLLGMYPNMDLKLVSEAYPNGSSEVQKRLLKLPDALVIDVEEASDIFRILKRERPVTSKLITISGPGVKPQTVVRVKYGTLLSEVFVHNFDFTFPKVDVYINGTLYGSKKESLKYVVDSFVDGIFVEEKGELAEESCINCGQCSKVCPMGLNPKYVFDHDGNVTPEYYDKCLQCGLCNYVCPANRDLKSAMGRGDGP